MIIYHPISDFLFELFPDAKGKGTEGLLELIRKFYSLGDFAPDVLEVDGVIEVHIDEMKLATDVRQFHRAVALCEKGHFYEAKKILEGLAERNPTNSEVHRILGQIASEQGDQDAAIDHMIDALRWDPKNGYALTMMGNIWAKYRNDIETATKYYDQALVVDPKDHIAANNVGANLLQLGRLEEAESWFQRALAINDKYPNTHYGLSVVAAQKHDLERAFHFAIEALKNNTTKDRLWQNSFQQARALATDLVGRHAGYKTVKNFAKELAERGGKPVEFERDSDIPTSAKLEVAENHDRAYHLVRFKPEHAEVQHLQMHELEHLRLIFEAREEGTNKLFVMRKEQRTDFIRSMDKHVRKLAKLGYDESSIGNYVRALVDGMNRQVFNAPIDLFIEQRIHDEYPELRPYQFLSMMQLLTEAIQATTAPRIVELTPPPSWGKARRTTSCLPSSTLNYSA